MSTLISSHPSTRWPAWIAIAVCLVCITGCFDTINEPFGERLSQTDVKLFEGIWADQDGHVCVLQKDNASQFSLGEIESRRGAERYSIKNTKLEIYQYRDKRFGFIAGLDGATMVVLIEPVNEREMTVASMIGDDQLDELCKQAGVEVQLKEEPLFSRHHVSDGKRLVEYAIEQGKLDVLFPKQPKITLKKLADWPSR